LKLLLNLNFGHPPPVKAYFVYGLSYLDVADQREVNLRELPGFPQFSLASSKGRLLVATLDSERSLFILTDEIEGFEIVEASYLVLLLRRAGVQHLHGVFTSHAIKPEARTGLIGVKDYLPYSSQHTAVTPSLHPVPLLSLGDALVWNWPGPTMPTEAEKKVAQIAGFDYVTIADL
jgi:hypothetical protein